MKERRAKAQSSEHETRVFGIKSVLPFNILFFFSPVLQVSTSRLKWGQEIASYHHTQVKKKKKITEFIKLMTHWTRATKSPPTVEPRGSWITPSERKRGCPGEAEGLATLEGEAAEGPRRGGVRVPSQGPHSRSRNAGTGSDMAKRTRRHPQVLGPRRDREEAAQPALPRPAAARQA